jgi:hypothetical protein
MIKLAGERKGKVRDVGAKGIKKIEGNTHQKGG